MNLNWIDFVASKPDEVFALECDGFLEHFLAGIEDGERLVLPVGSREILITFRVGLLWFSGFFLWHHWALLLAVSAAVPRFHEICLHAGPEESSLSARRIKHPLRRVHLCGSGHPGRRGQGAGAVRAHQYRGEHTYSDVWLTSGVAFSHTFSHRRAVFCCADSCRLSGRPGDPTAGEGHSKGEQLHLRRSLCSHQDQSAKVRGSPAC